MKAIWLFAFVLVNVVCGDLDNFLQAFPNGDYSAFDNIPKEAIVNEDQVETPGVTYAACPTIPFPPDTDDVNNLKPGNIKIVLSMGDSITAAMSAKDTSIFNLREYRGIAFCQGADAGVNTLPNILKPFTKELLGASIGIGTRTSAGNNLNGAVSGAVNSDMLGQAQWLVTQLTSHSGINIAQDWKLLTIWIGSNNLCAVCNNQAANDGANFEANLNTALTYLFTYLPKLFVNLISVLDVSSLYNINGGSCSLLHPMECACVGTSDATKRALVAATAKDYQARAITIAQRFNARGNNTQAVVVQPFLVNNVITDRSLLSAADCFHPSASAHSLAATALWNNMLTPAKDKKTSWDKNDVPICPTADSIFPTN